MRWGDSGSWIRGRPAKRGLERRLRLRPWLGSLQGRSYPSPATYRCRPRPTPYVVLLLTHRVPSTHVCRTMLCSSMVAWDQCQGQYHGREITVFRCRRNRQRGRYHHSRIPVLTSNNGWKWCRACPIHEMPGLGILTPSCFEAYWSIPGCTCWLD